MRRMWTGWDSRIRMALGGVAALLLAGSLVAIAGGGTGDKVDTEVGATAEGYDTGASVADESTKREALGLGVTSAGRAAATAGGGSSAPAPPTVGADASAQVVAPDGNLSALGQTAPGATGDKVIRTGELRLELKKNGFRAAFDRATALAGELGGFVANSNTERVGDRLAAGSLTLRVPGTRFDEARRRLNQLGTVEHESIRGQDVSGELVDLEARLRSLRAQEDVLRALLGRAKTVGEVIQVEQQLGGVRQQIEQMAAQEKHLNDQVAMATLQVSMFEKGAPVTPPEDEKPILQRSFDRAIDGALAVIGGTVVVIGYAIPLGVLALIGWALYRLVTRRRAAAVT